MCVRLGAQQAWAKAKGMDSVFYSDMFKVLNIEYQEHTNSRRKLKHTDLQDFFKGLGMDNNQIISIERFGDIYEWFTGFCRLVSVLNIVWEKEEPYTAIHGFVSRSQAEQMLVPARVGTFIIRFGSKAYTMCITYKDTQMSSKHIRSTLTGPSKGIERFTFNVIGLFTIFFVFFVCVFFAFALLCAIKKKTAKKNSQGNQACTKNIKIKITM